MRPRTPLLRSARSGNAGSRAPGRSWRTRARAGWLSKWAALGLALGTAPAGGAPAGYEKPAVRAPYRADSTRRMAGRLEQLAVQFDGRRGQEPALFATNKPRNIPLYRQRLLELQAAGPSELPRAINVQFALAQELLWAGRSEEAALELEALLGVLKTVAHRRGARETRARVRHLLAITHLRLGEQRNCLAGHTPDSCILPLRGGGIHRDPRGSRRAIELLAQELRRNPENREARWLVNLAYMTLGAYPDEVPPRWLIPPRAFDAEHDVKRFVDVGGATGTNASGLAGGAILEDFDGDGRLDVVTSSWGLRDPLRYFRNDGRGSFVDASSAAGLVGEVGGLNLSHADYDNDGDFDVLVLRGGWLAASGGLPNSLLRNNGDGTFDDVTEQAGLLAQEPSPTAAWADYDGDGWLDLFVGNEGPHGSDPHPCRLYRNRGDGTFEDRAKDLGLAELGFVKGATWGDYDNDGRPDLYVSRMGAANLLFRNDGPQPGAEGSVWRFSEVGVPAGVTEPRHSFPTWFWDYDNDGWLDLFVAAWDGADAGDVAAGYLGLPTTREHPRLFHNQRDGSFSDVTRRAKLDRVLLAMGANFGDIDNDGWLDLYVGTGAPDLSVLMPNRMFRNTGAGVFQDVTSSGGFGHLQKGHGIAFGDVDNDGDQDVYAVMGGWYSGDGFPNVLFENPGHGHHWITLRFRGVRSNRAGVGARIRVTLADETGERVIHRTVGSGGSFGSSSLQQEIGLGRARAIREIEVRWPASGTVQRFVDVPMDAVYRVVEGAGELAPVAVETFVLGRREVHSH